MAAPAPPPAPQEATKWVPSVFGGSTLVWVVDPDMQSIARSVRKALELPLLDNAVDTPQLGSEGQHQTQSYEDTDLSISFLAQGAFNKLYSVTIKTSITSSLQSSASSATEPNAARPSSSLPSHVLRITLPVDPVYKTLSEVATIEYIQQHTSIPVPQIYTYNSYASTNDIGFEWMLMEYMPGQQFREIWHDLCWSKKEKVVDVLAKWHLEMFRLRGTKIGNLYVLGDMREYLIFDEIGGWIVDEEPPRRHVIDRVVSMGFFGDPKLQVKGISKGPYGTPHEWLLTRLHMVIQKTTKRLSGSSGDSGTDELDEDDLEDLESLREVAELLLGNLDLFFSEEEDTQSAGAAITSEYALTHDDISLQNLLVCPTSGTLTALIDWECVSFVPLFKAASFPHVLQSPNRPDPKPDRALYATDPVTGRPDDLYFEHLKEWEQTKLRKRFLQAIEGLSESGGDEWLHVFNNIVQRKKRDFELAVQQCEVENLLGYRLIRRWIEGLKGGLGTADSEEDYESLWDMLSG